MAVKRQELHTAGLDDPRRNWLQQVVRVTTHPEWGPARVLRWYPAAAGQPERLRLMTATLAAPQIVKVTEVEVVWPQAAGVAVGG